MTAREVKTFIRRNTRRLRWQEGMNHKQAKLAAIGCIRWEYYWGDSFIKGGYNMKNFWNWIEA